MHFTVERNVFLEAIQKLSRIVSNRTAYPVLEGIFVSATQGKVTLIAYNLEISLKKDLYARTTVDGEAVLSAKLLMDIVRRLSGPTVELELDDKKVCHIRACNAEYQIETMDAADYPELPSFKEGLQLNLKSKELVALSGGTSFAVAPVEGARPILMGLNISVKDNVVKFVGIDGFRLAIRRMKVAESADMNFVIAGKNMEEIIRLVADADEDMQLLIGNNMIAFVIDGYRMICRLMEGEFVDYNRTIPDHYNQRLVVRTSDLLHILERISLLINDSFVTPVRVLIEEEQITFNCATNMGRITETYASDLQGEPFEIGLSARYMTEALKATEDDMVQMKFDGARQGVVIEPLEGDDYMYMIMPMRLTEHERN